MTHHKMDLIKQTGTVIPPHIHEIAKKCDRAKPTDLKAISDSDARALLDWLDEDLRNAIRWAVYVGQ